MKAKLLLSVAAVGFVAMSPAIAETVTIPVIPGSLDGANSTTGDGGAGLDATAIANSPTDSTNSASATGGAGGSGGNNGGNGGAATATATTTTTDASGNGSSLSSLSSATGGAGGSGSLFTATGIAGNGGAATASAVTTGRPARRRLFRPRRPPQEASAGVHPSAQLGRAGETAAMRPLQLWRSAAAVRSTCRPAQSAATAVQRAARAARPSYRMGEPVQLFSANPRLAQSLFKDRRLPETPITRLASLSA